MQARRVERLFFCALNAPVLYDRRIVLLWNREGTYGIHDGHYYLPCLRVHGMGNIRQGNQSEQTPQNQTVIGGIYL